MVDACLAFATPKRREARLTRGGEGNARDVPQADSSYGVPTSAARTG